MRNIYLVSLILFSSFLLISCSNEDNNNSGALGRGGYEEVNDSDKLTNGYIDLVVKKEAIETEERIIEGMEEEIEVAKYEIIPLGISYHIDERFGNPKVKNGIVTYSLDDNEYEITLKVVENMTLDEKVEKLQEQFKNDAYTEVGQLETLDEEENGLLGKMQYFLEPVSGFYVYEIEDRLLVITYKYPVEAGDGMEPLLHSLRQSISVN